VVAVEDGSTDGSPAILAGFARDPRVRVLRGEGRGAAAAINLGIRHARHPVICQVDQDVLLAPGWLPPLLTALAEPGVAAAQGYYATPRNASVWARVTGLDLELRYAGIGARHVDHVCTGNTAYRVEALRAVGLLDERLGYGYDNDLSYRLAAAGYRLAFCREARAVHRWRESARGALTQQYGFAYGRLDLVAKHPRRVLGDDTSGLGMLLHLAGTAAAGTGLMAALSFRLAGGAGGPLAAGAAGIAGLLALERAVGGVRAWRRFADPAALLFPPLHALRDLAWCAALVTWAARRLAGRPAGPEHSMGGQCEPAPTARSPR
jgi:hypothetical protein